MTKHEKFICTVALASLGLWGGSAAYGQQRPMDEANPGQTTQGSRSTTQGSRSTTATSPDATTGNKADAMFAKKAAEGGMAEVKLGELAQQKASSPQVKQFAQRMVTDHTKANSQLKEAAAQDNIAVPATLDSKDQATYEKLSKLSGSQFDREYIKGEVSDHQKDISEFKKEANSGSNPNIKSFAAQTLPTLQEHLSLAKRADQQVSQTSGSGYGNGARQGGAQ